MAINIGDYKTNARESGIMVGDRVLITRKAEYGENGWGGVWLSIKNRTVGKTGKVCGVTSDWDFHVRFDKNIECYYPYFVLRRVHRSPIVPRFTIGDRVLIKRSWEKGEYGTHIDFIPSKLKTIGKVGEIDHVWINWINNEIYYRIYFSECGLVWYYPEFVLRKFDKPNPDFEFEPFDTLLHITGPTLSR